jgi:hypothetical protein
MSKRRLAITVARLSVQSVVMTELATALALATTLFAANSSETRQETEHPRKIYAHYMACYPVAHGATNYHRNVEAPGLRHDKPTHPNLAAWRNFALLPEGKSLTLEQSMDLDIRRALRAGIDGFAVDMWAGGEEQCKKVIAALFKVVEEKHYPFEITLCWDTPWQDSGDQVSQLKWWLQTYGKSPKMGRFKGQPVMLGYYSVGKASNYAAQQLGELIDPKNHLNPSPRVRTTPEGWKLMAQWFRELERQVGQSIYWHFCIDGFFMRVDGMEQQELEQTKLVPAVRTLAQSGFAIGKFLGFDRPETEDKLARAVKAVGGEWSQPMWFQYDNAVNGFHWGKFQGTALLRDNWRKAREYDSHLLQFVTWNDYTENTCLAPAYQTHYSLYDLNAYFIQWWKTGKAPRPDHDRIYLTYRRYPKGAKTFPFPRRLYSDVESVLEVTTILPRAAIVRLPGRNIEYRAEPGLTARQFPLMPGPVIAEIVRGGKVQTHLESPDPITNKPFREQLNLYSFSTEEERHWKADFGAVPLQTFSEYGDVDKDGLPNWFEMYWFGKFLDWSTVTGAEPTQTRTTMARLT